MKPCPQCGHSWGSGVRDQSRLSLAVASSVASGSVVSVNVSEGWTGFLSIYPKKKNTINRDKYMPDSAYVKWCLCKVRRFLLKWASPTNSVKNLSVKLYV